VHFSRIYKSCLCFSKDVDGIGDDEVSTQIKAKGFLLIQDAKNLSMSVYSDLIEALAGIR
jgi:hypothetical protein